MTTTQSFHSHALSVDIDDDKMEMATSPYPEPHDNDDDIDFELDDQREHSIEDNSMIDDNTENMDTNLEQNDMMFDEEDNDLIDFDQDLQMDPDQPSYTNEPDNNVQEEEEQLAQPAPHDQSIQDTSFEDATVAEQNVEHREDEMEGNDLQEEVTNTDFNPIEDPVSIDTIQEPEIHLTTNTEDQSIAAAARDENAIETQTSDIKDFAVEGATVETSEQGQDQSPNEENTIHEEPSIEPEEGTEEDKQVQQSVEALATELDQSTEQADDDVAASAIEHTKQSPKREATPIALHPVTIHYNGEDCWLFPPIESTEERHVFLEDVALASEPFDRLLAALRSGLVNDQEMADHDELVLDIPVLGLHICEDSKHASLMNLSRVIDIYMMLSQNEGLTVFEPLHCELSTRVCLADQFAYVDDAAFVRRITYTDFVAEQAGSPDEVTEDLNVENAEAVISIAQDEEQIDASTSNYYDATDDSQDAARGEEREPIHNDSIEAQVHEQNSIPTEPSHNAHHEQSDTEPDILDDDTGDEEIEAHAGNVQDSAGSPAQIESDGAADAGQDEDAQRGSQSLVAHDDEVLTTTQQYEEPTEEIEDTTVEIEADADEDLFADDAVEDSGDAELDESKQINAAENNGMGSESLSKNDDFDFDNWSDDEHEITRTEIGSDRLATPSKGVNGKRKLLDEEEDFLDLDISTPEPKRSRPS